MSASVPALGVMSSAGAASASGSSGRHECAWESPRSELRHRHSSRWGRSRLGEKRGKGRSPSPARSSHLARVSAASSDAGEQEGAMPPPPAGRPGVGGSWPGGDCSALDYDHSPQPGPSGLGSGLWSSPDAARSRSGFVGRSSPISSGAAEDNPTSTFDSVDLDRDDSFRAVLRLIWEVHSMEELASVAPNRCKTSLAPVYGLQSRVFPGSSLASFPLAAVSP